MMSFEQKMRREQKKAQKLFDKGDYAGVERHVASVYGLGEDEIKIVGTREKALWCIAQL